MACVPYLEFVGYKSKWRESSLSVLKSTAKGQVAEPPRRAAARRARRFAPTTEGRPSAVGRAGTPARSPLVPSGQQTERPGSPLAGDSHGCGGRIDEPLRRFAARRVQIPGGVAIRNRIARLVPGDEGTWLRGEDLNLRPLGYEPNELPGCSTPRQRREPYRSGLAASRRVIEPRTGSKPARSAPEESPRNRRGGDHAGGFHEGRML